MADGLVIENTNLKRYADCAKKLNQRVSERLPKGIFNRLRSAKRKLWWRYSAYRKAKPDGDLRALDFLATVDGKQGACTALDGSAVTVNRFVTVGEQNDLYALITETKPRVAVEIGLANGYSTLAILQGLADKKCGMLLSIDPFQITDYRGAALMNARRCGLDGYHLWWGENSLLALPKLLEAKARVDFAFIDGNHMFDYTMIEFCYLDKILRKGGIVVFHDYCYPSVRACVNFIERNFPYAVIPNNEKNIRVLKKQEDDTRAWYYFRPFEVPQIEWTTVENRQICD